jgi:hypothetical protein
MAKEDLSLSTFLAYVEDFKFGIQVAGMAYKPPEKEVAKCFVQGLRPDLFRDEMQSRAFETVDQAIVGAREALSHFRDILEASMRLRLSDARREKGKFSDGGARKVAVAPKSPETPKRSPTMGTPAKLDLSKVECYHCHKKGHYANKCPEKKMQDKTFPGPRVRKLDVEDTTVRSLRIRFTDLEQDEDPFLRYEVMVFDYHSQTSENLVEPTYHSVPSWRMSKTSNSAFK